MTGLLVPDHPGERALQLQKLPPVLSQAPMGQLRPQSGSRVHPVVGYFGILYAGCTVVPLNVLLSAPEVSYHLEDSDARLLIAHATFGDAASRGAAEAGVEVVWAGAEGTDGIASMASAAPVSDVRSGVGKGPDTRPHRPPKAPGHG